MLVEKYVPGYVVDPWGKGQGSQVVSPNDIALQVSVFERINVFARIQLHFSQNTALNVCFYLNLTDLKCIHVYLTFYYCFLWFNVCSHL